MYRRGPYYKAQSKLASLREDMVLVGVVALFAGLGLGILPHMASAWQSSRLRHAQTTVAHKKTALKVAVAPTGSTSAPANKPESTTGSAAPAAVGLPLSLVPTLIPAGVLDLLSPSKKEIAMRLVSSAENSSTNWRAQFAYIEDIGDGRGFTAGIVGFCSGTGDMLELVQYYTQIKPGNALATYLPALKQVDGTDSHAGLGTAFVAAWKAAAADPAFQQAQEYERDRVYLNPAVTQAKTDGLHTLGQFIYYDALVMHGPGNDASSFGGLRASVVSKIKPPSQGGDETVYLNAFLDARKKLMLTEAAHDDTSRVDTEQRTFLSAGNLDLNTPLSWKTYGDAYTITSNP